MDKALGVFGISEVTAPFEHDQSGVNAVFFQNTFHRLTVGERCCCILTASQKQRGNIDLGKTGTKVLIDHIG